MKKRTLGNTQRTLPAIGLGCMGLSEFYGPPTERSAAIGLLHEAIEMGVEHFDTAEMYGIGSANESLLGEAFGDRRDKVFIATKFGPLRDPETGEFTGIDGSRENCRRAVGVFDLQPGYRSHGDPGVCRCRRDARGLFPAGTRHAVRALQGRIAYR